MIRLLSMFAIVAAVAFAASSAEAGGPKYANPYGAYQPYQNRVAYPSGGWNQQNFGNTYGYGYGVGYYNNYSGYYGNLYGTYGGYNYGPVRTFNFAQGAPANEIRVLPMNGGSYNIPGVGTASGFQNVIVLPPGATVQSLGY